MTVSSEAWSHLRYYRRVAYFASNARKNIKNSNGINLLAGVALENENASLATVSLINRPPVFLIMRAALVFAC